MSLTCPRCSAPYTGSPIPAWVNSVKCEYCGGSIVLRQIEELQQATKLFDANGLESFMKSKGVPYDPVSGAVIVGGSTFFIDATGAVMPEQPQTLRTTVLRWLAEYMNE